MSAKAVYTWCKMLQLTLLTEQVQQPDSSCLCGTNLSVWL